MKKVLLKKKLEIIKEVEFIFRSIADFFDEEKNAESKLKIDQGWYGLYQSAVDFVAPYDLSDFDFNNNNNNNNNSNSNSNSNDNEKECDVDELGVLECPLICGDSYDFLHRALISCLQIGSPYSTFKGDYSLSDWVDKLAVAYLYLGKAELYSDIYYTKKANIYRAGKGGQAKNKRNNERRLLLVEELRRRILVVKDKNQKMSREDFVKCVAEDVFEFAAEHSMGYCFDGFEDTLLGVLKVDKGLRDLFKIHLAKR